MIRLFAFALFALIVFTSFADAGCGLLGRLRDRRAERRGIVATVRVQVQSSDCASGNCNSARFRLFGRRR